MQAKLIIYLQHLAAPVASWAFISESGTVLSTMTKGDISQLSTQIFQHDITVVLPAEDVATLSVTLPKMSRNKLLQALPFALEETVLSDLDTTHFACGERQVDGTLPIAIVNKPLLNTCLTYLASHQIYPHKMISAFFTIPWQTDTWLLQHYEGMFTARLKAFSGFTCDAANIAPLLAFELSNNKPAPEKILLSNYSQTSISLPAVVEKKYSATQFIEDCARNIDSQAINLLQGDFETDTKQWHSQKIWLAAGIAALAWLLLFIINNTVSYAILHNQARDLNQQIRVIYKKNFPQASDVIAPKQRLQKKLNSLVNGSGSDKALQWLANVGAYTANHSNLKILHIDYRNNLLNLTISAAKAQDLDALTQALQAQGMTVKTQNISIVHQQTQGDVLISNGGSQ